MNHFSFEKKKKLNILILGRGGREYALARVLSTDERVKAIVVSPGNGGTQLLPNTFNKSKETNYTKYDLVIPGSEAYLAEGVADICRSKLVPCFGPSKSCARLETSKAFAKTWMQKYNLPTASFRIVHNNKEALELWKDYPILKADGLMGGKGVFIPDNEQEAKLNIETLFSTQTSIVMEKKVKGDEYSVLCFCDGKTIMPLPVMKDYKRLLDNDQGPNTGGMGCTGPYNIEMKFLEPLQRAIKKDFPKYVGCLYIGLMGDTILEFNVRFGDPEIQSLTHLLGQDFPWLDYILGTVDRTLYNMPPLTNFIPNNTFVSTVVICHPDYPIATETFKANNLYDLKGDISGLDGSGFTIGGRLCSVSQVGSSIATTSKKIYHILQSNDLQRYYYRLDI